MTQGSASIPTTARPRRVYFILAIVVMSASVAFEILAAEMGFTLSSTFHSSFEADSNYITVNPNAPHEPDGRTSGPGLLYNSDVDALERLHDPSMITEIIPYVQGNAWIRNGTKKYRALLDGSTPEYMSYQNFQAIRGTVFTPQQTQEGARVILLGDSVVSSLFDNVNDAIGSQVFVGRHGFRVIGILHSPRALPQALVPLNAARDALFGGAITVQGIGVRISDPGVVESAMTNVISIIDKRHHEDSRHEDFAIDSPWLTTPYFSQLTSLIHSLTYGVCIALLILGGIGLFAILLAGGGGFINGRSAEAETSFDLQKEQANENLIAKYGLIAAAAVVTGATLGMGSVTLFKLCIIKILPTSVVFFGSRYSIPVTSTGWHWGAIFVSFLASIAIGVTSAVSAAMRCNSKRRRVKEISARPPAQVFQRPSLQVES